MPDMPVEPASRRARSLLRDFLHNSASGGLVLMAAAAIALILANSGASERYFGMLAAYLGPLSVLHWINDGLMAVFFLLVGLEIKRELLDGQLASWGRRILPGVAAAGGMAVPALIYVAFNAGNPATLRGWAIPAATDIAFALGVLALLGSRVPASLRIFLAALAILDDLGAVAIIAVFYTGEIALPYLGLAGLVSLALLGLNRAGVCRLAPYLLLGAALWWLTLRSGVHATVAGVLLAFAIPLRNRPGGSDDLAASPLHRLEHALHLPVAFLIVPVFGFANAGVSFDGLTREALLDPLTLGVAAGLLFGKLIGVFGAAAAAIKLGWADMPVDAHWGHLLGTALLCGIGFTMSLFIGMLAFEGEPLLQAEVKIGILAGSLLAGVSGALVLRLGARRG